MSRRMVIAAASVLACASLLFAQNARVDAMGGVGIIDDISGINGNPADVNDYADQVQATAGPGGVGLFLGIKSLGDALNLGIMGNTGGVLQGDFYGQAPGQINAATQTGITLADPYAPRIPHLLVGLDMGDFDLGLDFFVELTQTRFKDKTEAAAESVEKEKARIANIGGFVSANIGGGDLAISPMVGFSLPRVRVEYEDDPGGGGAVTTSSYESEKGLMGLGGIEIGLPMMDLDWTVGAFYSYELYQFVAKAAGAEQKTDKWPNHFIDAYIGFETEIIADVLTVVEYDLSLGYEGTEGQSTAGAVTTSTTQWDFDVDHAVRAGLEKAVGDVWIFDELSARAGLVLTVDEGGDKVKTEVTGGATDSETRTRTIDEPTVANIVPRVGVGLKKGRFSFDVRSGLAGWDGLVSGPPVVEGTITLDFGGSASMPLPEIESTPAEESEPIPSTDFEF